MSELEKFAQRYEVDVEHVRRWIVEAMVLGAVADGNFDRRESDEIIRMISDHAEFTGMGPEELHATLDRAFEGIVKDGFNVRLYALAGALPGYAQRVLAFRCAVRVAFANGMLENDEIDFLRKMQTVLGISEGDVARAFDSAQGGGSDPLDEEVEPVEAYLDCLLMAAAADKELRDEELATIIAFVVSREEFAGLDEDHVRDYINQRLRLFATGGTMARLETLGDDLIDEAQRENAYGLAIAMCIADGELAHEEKSFLLHLRRALDVDTTAADRLLAAFTGA